MQEAVAYTCQDNLPYYYDPGELPDRLYARWRSAMLRRDAAQVGLIQIRSPNLARVLKGFQPKQVDLAIPNPSMRDRVFRGILLRQRRSGRRPVFAIRRRPSCPSSSFARVAPRRCGSPGIKASCPGTKSRTRCCRSFSQRTNVPDCKRRRPRQSSQSMLSQDRPSSPAGQGRQGWSRHGRGCRMARCRRNGKGPARR